jgi:transposase
MREEKLTLTREQQEARRFLAGQMFQQGKRDCEVAALLRVCRSSVGRWRAAFAERSWDGLKSKTHPGRSPRLDARQKERLTRILLQGARKAGYATELWTCARVAQVIERNFGVGYHPRYPWEILRQLDWSCQRPEHQAREADERAIARWRKKEWPRIKRGPAAS